MTFSANSPVPPVLTVRHVFVYGTLCRGELRDINLLRPAAVFVGHATVRGLLYDLGQYPGVVLEEHAEGVASVHGEVYAIEPELEQMLDEIEEVWPQQTGEYNKRDAVAQLCQATQTGLCRSVVKEPEEVPCFLYEINPSRVSGKTEIAGGDWVSYRRALRL
jgi:gamma-glutamylcyclotransferase (GGCT)/AIG2-like uncharacterized protein YtfP